MEVYIKSNEWEVLYMMIAKREEWIDYVKAIGIILVVAGHCNLPEGIINFIYLFNMPLFFFC